VTSTFTRSPWRPRANGQSLAAHQASSRRTKKSRGGPFESPLGRLGRIVDDLILSSYLEKLIRHRNQVIRLAAERPDDRSRRTREGRVRRSRLSGRSLARQETLQVPPSPPASKPGSWIVAGTILGAFIGLLVGKFAVGRRRKRTGEDT
jgi:hypothetical protein